MLNWLQQFSTFCFLDNHQYQLSPHSMECLAGVGVRSSVGNLQPSVVSGQSAIGNLSAGRQGRQSAKGMLDELQKWIDQPGRSWIFGHLGYDLKNEIENVYSLHPDRVGFPDLYFFEPEIIIRLTEREMIIEAVDPDAVYQAISTQESLTGLSPAVKDIISRFSKEEYTRVIGQLKQHILRGDCYEINFCQEFYCENAVIDPVIIYKKLSSVSPNPFSAFYRVNDQWLICASPERFLRRQGRSILSQPIKGTSKRSANNSAEDEENRVFLSNSEKDRAENVMVVDLVRNDLSRICTEGSVKVEELYGIYSFPQVHQMISTVSGELKKDISFAEIIRACFPMGSMTGAPKKRVMELIEQYERTRRGIFSGAVGYISPEGDFDLNVVIRSIMYNAASGYLSYQAGSGITFYSDPENEWEECLLKADAIREVLTR